MVDQSADPDQAQFGLQRGRLGADSVPTKRQGNPVARIPLSIRYVLVDPTGIEPVTS